MELTRRDACVQAGTQVVAAAQERAARTRDYLAAWLPERLLERLFQMAQAIARHVLAGAAAPEARFPALPGSHLTPAQLGTPALAFVRTVCHVLALDGDQEEVVRPCLASCCM